MSTPSQYPEGRKKKKLLRVLSHDLERRDKEPDERRNEKRVRSNRKVLSVAPFISKDESKGDREESRSNRDSY